MQLAMLQYFGGISTHRHARDECDLLLLQSGQSGQPSASVKLGGVWKKIWEGGRSSDKTERFSLYRRMNN
jgi:hypothetical protein